MRPRPLSAMPWSFIHARMSALRSRLVVVLAGRCRCLLPVLRACYEIGGELLTESGGVRGAQIDLVVGAADPESHCLACRAAIKIVF
jgi:hypothetical protein